MSYETDHSVRSRSQQSSNRTSEALSNFFNNRAREASEHNFEVLRPHFLALAREFQENNPSSRGVSEEFFDSLPRIDKKKLKSDDTCAICTSFFLEDEYPLVVRLRCGHMFDLGCIRPWLEGNTSCPLCRTEVDKKKEIVVEEDSEEEFDDMYG